MNEAQAIELLTNTIRRKHLALSTERTYRLWFVQFLRFVRTVPPSLSSEKKIELWLTGLALKNVAASTQNQAFNAVLFFYRSCLNRKLGDINALRAKRGERVRRAPSVDEVQMLLNAVRDADGYPTNLVASLLYGCGLRVSEPLNLRVRDVDFSDGTLTVRGAKGDKDRVVPIPLSLVGRIHAQMVASLAVWESDKAGGLPVKLPNRIAQKYPAARFSSHWAYLFPLRAPCPDPWTKEPVRYRMLEYTVQRAVRRACLKIGTDILPHELRHSYATHCLNRGENPRAIQLAMGHKSMETTMGYLHAEATSVRSPLDYLRTAGTRQRGAECVEVPENLSAKGIHVHSN